jgi:hypothetical protein
MAQPGGFFNSSVYGTTEFLEEAVSVLDRADLSGGWVSCGDKCAGTLPMWIIFIKMFVFIKIALMGFWPGSTLCKLVLLVFG